jgi:putative ABC transport system permease protein
VPASFTFRLWLSLAVRNLTRHGRRTLLTGLALAIGIALMVLGRAWIAAMEHAVVDPAKDGTLGHVQVFAADAAADEGGHVSFILPQNNYRLIADPRKAIERVLAAEPRLEAGLGRLMVGALFSSGEESMEGLVIGIDPTARAAVYPALGLRSGRYFVPGENGVLLNRGVARRLGVEPGDTIVALGNSADGRLNAVRLKVTGIWVIPGLDAYEWGACFADLAAAQELLDVGDSAGVLVFRQRDPGAPSAGIAASVDRAFARDARPLAAYTWEELGGPFIGGMMLTRFVSRIMDFMMAVIVAAGVLNTAMMSVFERTREVGTMRAIGAPRARVLLLFLLESLMLGVGGAVAGSVAGVALILIFGRYGIPAFSEAQRYSYGGDFLYPQLAWGHVTWVPAIMITVCVIAGLGPAWAASRMRPADALRHV